MLTSQIKSTLKRGIFNVKKANFGANEKILKIRMGAVDNIRKITSAMKMVATAKMRHDMDRLVNGKDFGVSVVPTILASDEYMNKMAGDFEPQTTLIVPISTDKGLCGGINGAIVRHTRDMILEDPERYELLPIGDKGASGLARLFEDKLKNAITEIELPMNYSNASAISHYIMNYPGEYEEILVIYNHFKNQMSQVLTEVSLIAKEPFMKRYKNLVKYEAIEPELEYSSQYFYELYVSSQFYHCFLHSAASEQASRMNAMENASSNAKDILEGLTLKYNQARQARITMELIEIISGANAL